VQRSTKYNKLIIQKKSTQYQSIFTLTFLLKGLDQVSLCKICQGNSARLYEPKILMNAALFLIDSTTSLMILSSIWPSKST
jgi:hypothetical protein